MIAGRLSSQRLDPFGDFAPREEDRAVVPPSPKGLGQQGCGAGSGGSQLVDDPKDTVYPDPVLGGDSSEQGVARQQDPMKGTCGNQTEAVIRGQCAVTLPECHGLRDFVRRQVMGDQAMIVEVPPFLVGKVADFQHTHGKWDQQSVRQAANGFQ